MSEAQAAPELYVVELPDGGGAIIIDLEALTSLRAEIMAVQESWEAIREELIPEDVKQQLSDLEEEMMGIIEPLRQKAKVIENRIRKRALEHGESVTTDGLSAIVSNRRNWDTDGLLGAAAFVPQILDFLTEKLSVTIR